MHIFISYAKKDTRELALRLRDTLIAQPGVTAWMDESLQAGENFADQIEAEIDRCQLMIVLLSPDVNREATAFQSISFVKREIHYAQAAHKTIIPIMAQKTKVPGLLAGDHYLDFTANQDAGLKKLIESICKRGGIESQQGHRKPFELKNVWRIGLYIKRIWNVVIYIIFGVYKGIDLIRKAANADLAPIIGNIFVVIVIIVAILMMINSR